MVTFIREATIPFSVTFIREATRARQATEDTGDTEKFLFFSALSVSPVANTICELRASMLQYRRCLLSSVKPTAT